MKFPLNFNLLCTSLTSLMHSYLRSLYSSNGVNCELIRYMFNLTFNLRVMYDIID